MTSEVGGAEGTPPVPTSASPRYSGQVPGRIAATWVHHPDRYPTTGLLDRPPKITVVTDHHRSVEATELKLRLRADADGKVLSIDLSCGVDAAGQLGRVLKTKHLSRSVCQQALD